MQQGLAVAALLLVYADALLAYLKDQHYQEHFVFLWAFLAAALWRDLRGPYRSRFDLLCWRDRFGLLVCAASWLSLAASRAAGSTTVARCSLALSLVSLAILCVQRWTLKRCLAHGFLLLLCFGVPYSVYFPLTSRLQWGAAKIVGLPAQWGWFDYELVGNVVVFPHYHLTITADCSGLGQVLTFLGIATLALLVGAPRAGRSLLLLSAALGLAWASNLTRLLVFMALVGIGWTNAIDSEYWHAAIGFLVFLPFVVLLIALAMRTHEQRTNREAPATKPGRLPILLLLLPPLLLHFGLRSEAQPLAEPSYFSALLTPPGHALEARAPSEASDRSAYATPWLLNARFRPQSIEAGDRYFDLLHYSTNSTSHLCVHKIAACLDAPEQNVRYAESVDIEGNRWWRIALDRPNAADSLHVYFAFTVAGERRDDSAATQWRVFYERLRGGDRVVQLDRVVFPGPLPEAPDEYAVAVLSWIGKQTGGR